MQSGVGQETAAVTGGGPPLQAGGPPQALAGVAARLSEPTVRTAESSAPPIPPPRWIFAIIGSSVQLDGPTVTQAADATLKPR